MKKLLRYILILGLLFIGKTVFAISPETLLDIKNDKIVGTSTSLVYKGTPAVLISPAPKTDKPQINRAEQLPPPDLTVKDIQIPIKTPFGHNHWAININQTTDYVVFVHILDNQSIRVQEQIQFLIADKEIPFQRKIPTNFKQSNLTVRVLDAQLNNQPLTIKQDKTETVLSSEKLETGLYQASISYLIQGGIQTDGNLANIFIPLTGTRWPLPTERFSVLVWFPTKMTVYSADLLFGTNNVSIENGYVKHTQRNGSVLFQLNRPLPAFSNVNLRIIGNATDLPVASENILPSQAIVFGIYILIVLFYTCLSIYVARHRKWKNAVRSSRSINPVLYTVMTEGKKSSPPFKQTLINRIFEKLPLFTLKGLGFIRFNAEYILGHIILIGITVKLTHIYQSDLTVFSSTALYIISFVSVIIIHRYGTKQELTRLKETVHREMTTKPTWLNPSNTQFQNLKQLAEMLGFKDEWVQIVKTNNPSYTGKEKKK